MVEKTHDSLASLEALALGANDNAFQRNAAELREMIGSPSLGNVVAVAALTDDQRFVQGLKYAWSQLYHGADNWPKELVRAYRSIEMSIGLGSFNNNLIASLQDLRLFDETVPAFNTAMDIVAKFALPDLAEQALQLRNATGFIPDSAAQAGLRFISNPAALVIPMWSAGLFGRAAAAITANIGGSLGLASETITALGVATSVPVEASAFMATGAVIAPRQTTGEQALMGPESPTEQTTMNEFVATSIFLGGLKLFSWAGALAQSILPATELGAAAARLTGHATSVVGLATMDKVQVVAGLVPENSENFTTALWRSLFLHATVQSVSGVISVTGARSDWLEMLRKAEDVGRQGGIDTLVPVFAGSTGQQIMGLPAAANRDRQGNMEKRGGDMPRTFLAEKSSEDKDKKIGMFERAISRELSEMTSRQLSLQVSVSFKKHSDFLVRHGLAKCNTVLDVGTGNGDFCCRLAELYPNIQFTGIDLKGDLIERAIQLSHDRGITNTNWVIGDISTHQLGKSESSFDGILLRYTDIHMPTTVPTLVE